MSQFERFLLPLRPSSSMAICVQVEPGGLQDVHTFYSSIQIAQSHFSMTEAVRVSALRSKNYVGVGGDREGLQDPLKHT